MNKGSTLFMSAGLALSFFMGCKGPIGKSTEVAQSTIFQEYIVERSENSDELNFHAHFSYRGGNVGLELAEASKVVLNGEKMQLKGYYYSHTQKLDPNIKEFTFVYTNNEGKVFNNTVRMPEEFKFASSDIKASKAQGLKLEWVGAPFRENENLELQFDNDGMKLKSYGSPSEFDKNEIAKITPGSKKIRVTRTLEKKEIDINTTIIERYKSEDKVIAIEE